MDKPGSTSQGKADDGADDLEDDPILEPADDPTGKAEVDPIVNPSDDPVPEAGQPEGDADDETAAGSPDSAAGDTADAATEAPAEPAPADALAQSREELAALNDKYVRLYAEFENFRKRTAMDREDLRRYANEQIVCDLLSVIDHLEMALQHSDEASAGKIVEGVRMTLKEFERLLEKHGVRAITAAGQAFDPTLHHAMSQVVTTEHPENAVVEEFRKGYQLHEKLIRPALVSVAKTPEPDGPAEGAGDDRTGPSDDTASGETEESEESA